MFLQAIALNVDGVKDINAQMRENEAKLENVDEVSKVGTRIILARWARRLKLAHLARWARRLARWARRLKGS